MYIYLYIYICTHIYVHIHINKYLCKYTYMYVYAYMCLYKYIHTNNIYMNIYVQSNLVILQEEATTSKNRQCTCTWYVTYFQKTNPKYLRLLKIDRQG